MGKFGDDRRRQINGHSVARDRIGAVNTKISRLTISNLFHRRCYARARLGATLVPNRCHLPVSTLSARLHSAECMNPAPALMFLAPVTLTGTRLDTVQKWPFVLSRRERGFDSRWDHQEDSVKK